MMKRFLLFLFLFPALVFAQDYSANWQGMYSYYQIQDISYANGKVYAAAENTVFSYQIGSGAIEKISSIQGLSGDRISEIYYSANHDALLIGYENGLIEIVQEDEEEVLSVIDIMEKQTIPPDEKIIHHFYEFENQIYISTGYGISVYNLESMQFGGTYFIGNNGALLPITQTAVLGNKIYAATLQGGIRRANVNNPNLVDFHNWETIAPGYWRGIVSFQNTIYAARANNSLYKLQGNSFVPVQQFNQDIQDLRASQEVLTLTTTDEVHIYDEQFHEVITVDNLQNETLNLSSAQYFGNTVFLGHTQLGLLKVSASATTQFQVVSPNGPLMNQVFDMTAIPNELWVVYGAYNKVFNPYPHGLEKRGASHLSGGTWTNIPYENLQEAVVLADIAINPNNVNEVYISSYFSGLLQFENNELVKLYNNTNSNLESIASADTIDIRIGGIAFDRQGNLYLTNGLVEHPLKKLTPGGEIQNIDVSEVFPTPLDSHVSELIVDDAGNVYFGTHDAGIVAYQPSTNTAKKIDDNVPGVDFPDSYNPNPVISAMTLDDDNRLWIGTDYGLRVMYSPASIFQENENVNVQPIIFLEGDVAQELFFGQYITDIAVDGANNKWVSTGDAGIFYISENGQKTIHHFTKDNSPLPSNSINSVEIDAVSGAVYIGTINGLVVFQGSAVKGAETLANVYAYPNPVRPGYDGMVTIAKLTENANVKITDITGNLVYEVVAEDGSIKWDTRAFGRHKVASGVYLVLITGEDAIETKVTKIMIIR